MGHIVNYLVVENKKNIREAAADWAFYNVDRYENPSGSYHNSIKMFEGTVLDSYKEAVEWAERMEQKMGAYNDFAVRFKDIESIKLTKPLQKKAELKEALVRQKWEIERDNNPYSLMQSGRKTKKCPKCGEVHALKYLRNWICDCGHDMQSEKVKKQIEKVQVKINKIDADLNNYRAKKEAKVKWLVKVEVHC